MERPGHGLDEYLAKLNAIPRSVHVSVGGAAASTRDGAAPDEDLDALVDRVARKMADKQDRGL